MKFPGLRLVQALTVMTGALAMGCGRPSARAAFAADFDCPDAVAEETEAANRYRVSGCGQEATYICEQRRGGVCAIQVVHDTSSSTAKREPTRDSSRTMSARPGSDSRSGKLELELDLQPKAILRLTAAPGATSAAVQIKLLRNESSREADKCGLDWMLNGQVVEMPNAVPARKHDLLALRVDLGQGPLGELSAAEKIALRSCSTRWQLTPDQVQQVRDFIARFQDEIAWSQPARGGSTGGRATPQGGWPEWSADASSLPKSAEGTGLDGRELFKKLSVSVFQLEASRNDGTAQGSAVAVSDRELLTNCHVVQGALKLTLKQGKQQWPASLLRADPKTDRCTVTAQGAKLQPVAGVRSHDSLEVGEPAYTLGSPVGLELTLSSGIVSGRREEGGQRYVQTTAPISPGSSGGGLFDARGNLIGITTLVLVGKEHLNQSLNFAIPADAYWQP
jgi:S1-C subfamily serine protease